MDKQTIGQIICTYRKKKGLTQKALAEQLNVTDKAVSKWERDIARPDISIIPKLAENLGITIEELMNVTARTTPSSSVKDSENESIEFSTVQAVGVYMEDEWNPEEEKYWARLKRMLLRGIIGFAVGFLFALIVSSESGIGFAALVGLFLAGVPYGWEIVGRFLGNWIVLGHIVVMIIAFVIRFVLSILIGWVAYPIALTYTLMKAQRKGSKLKTVFKVLHFTIVALVVVFAIIIIILAIYDSFDKKGASPSSETTSSQKNQFILDATYFTSANTEYITLCAKTLEDSRVLEAEAITSGAKILVPTTIKGAYFLTMDDPESVHTHYGHSLKMKNAVLLVTSYYVEQPGWYKREEWTVWAFPDFSITEANTLTYDARNVYYDYILREDLDEVYEWICTEYAEMVISQLEIPSDFS